MDKNDDKLKKKIKGITEELYQSVRRKKEIFYTGAGA